MSTILFSAILYLIFLPANVLAGPASDNYELQNYSFGAGGTDTAFTSDNYGLYGIVGQVESGRPGSDSFYMGEGLIYLNQSGLPPAPTLSNNGNLYYNKLSITINYSTIFTSIPSDILFAIAVSTDFGNPSLTRYVQTDQTLGGSPFWQSYTAWGGSSGFILSGLQPDTTYYAKVAARQGIFTQTGYGQTADISTAPNSITFNVRTEAKASPPFTLDLGILTPGSVISTADEGRIDISTNAVSGALVYIYGANAGLTSSSQGSYTISSVSASGQDLSLLQQGYGLRGTSATQNSGTLVISEPFNGSGDVVGPLDTSQRILFTTDDAPVDAGVGRFEIRAKASMSAPPASDYTDTITIIAAGSF